MELENASRSGSHLTVLERHGVAGTQDLLGKVVEKKDVRALTFAANWVTSKTFLLHRKTNKKKNASGDVTLAKINYACWNAECKLLFKWVSRDGGFRYTLQEVPVHSACCFPEASLYGRTVPGLVQSTILREIPEFVGLARKHVKYGAQDSEFIKVLKEETDMFSDCPKSTVTDILNEMRKKQFEADNMAYHLMVFWLEQYCDHNPGSSVVVQNDTAGRFMRAVLIPGATVDLMSQGVLKGMMSIDCGFSKIVFFGGKFCIGVSPTGNGKSVPLFLAIVPAENAHNLCWVICILWQSGVKLDLAEFTDRGQLIAAAQVLAIRLHLLLALKFCLEHIDRNTYAALKVTATGEESTRIRDVVTGYCQAPSVAASNWHLLRSPEALGGKGYHLMAYLAQIPPRCIVHVANSENTWNEQISLNARVRAVAECIQASEAGQTRISYLSAVAEANQSGTEPPPFLGQSFVDKAAEIIQECDSVHIGGMKPLMGASRTSAVEPAMSASLHRGVRNNQPPKAFVNFAKWHKEVVDQEILAVKRLAARCDDGDLVPAAFRHWQQAKDRAARLRVEDRTLTGGNHLSVRITDGPASNPDRSVLSLTVLLDQLSGDFSIKCPCLDCNMRCWVCPHMIRAYQAGIEVEMFPVGSVDRLKTKIDNCYFLRACRDYAGAQVVMPALEPEMMEAVGSVTATTKVTSLPKPAPLYSFPKSLLGKAPGRRASRGELGASTRTRRPRGGRGRLTASSAPTRVTKVTASYLRDIQLLNDSQALEDPRWTPVGKSQEVIDACERALAVADGSRNKKKGCSKCGNPGVSDKYCPCQCGPVVAPQDQVPGDYSLYVIRGQSWDQNHCPPDLHCESSGLNDDPRVMDQCQVFLDALPSWACPRPSVPTGEQGQQSTADEVEQERGREAPPTHSRQESEGESHASSDRELPPMSDEEGNNPDQESDESHASSGRQFPGSRLFVEAADGQSHSSLESQPQVVDANLDDPASQEHLNRHEHPMDDEPCMVCAEPWSAGDLHVLKDCCHNPLCVTCLANDIKRLEGEGFDPTHRKSSHGLPYRCQCCQTPLDDIRVQTPAEARPFSLRVIDGNRTATRELRISVVKDLHELMDLWDCSTSLMSDQTIIRKVLTSFDKSLNEDVVARSERQRENLTRFAQACLDNYSQEGSLEDIRLLHGRQPAALFTFLVQASRIILPPTDESSCTRFQIVREKVRDALSFEGRDD